MCCWLRHRHCSGQCALALKAAGRAGRRRREYFARPPRRPVLSANAGGTLRGTTFGDQENPALVVARLDFVALFWFKRGPRVASVKRHQISKAFQVNDLEGFFYLRSSTWRGAAQGDFRVSSLPQVRFRRLPFQGVGADDVTQVLVGPSQPAGDMAERLRIALYAKTIPGPIVEPGPG